MPESATNTRIKRHQIILDSIKHLMTIGIASFAIVAAFLDKLEKRRVYVAVALVILFLSICLSLIAMFLAVREVPTRGKTHRRLLLTVNASIFAYIIALLLLMIIALISIGRD